MFIGLLGIFSYYNIQAANNFRGSSSTAKNLLLYSGSLCNTSFFVFLIWAFFVFTWWQPIIVLVLTPFTAVVFEKCFNRNIIVMLLSLVACPIFWILSLLSLLNLN